MLKETTRLATEAAASVSSRKLDIDSVDDDDEANDAGDGIGLGIFDETDGILGNERVREQSQDNTATDEQQEVSGFVVRLEQHTRESTKIQVDLEEKINDLQNDDHEAATQAIKVKIAALQKDTKRLRRLFAFKASHGIALCSQVSE